MTDKQPEALRLANDLEIDYGGDVVAHEAAAELRRLQAKNERLKTLPMKYRRMEFNAQLQTENDRLRAQRDELLAAAKKLLKELEALRDSDEYWGPVNDADDALIDVIAKVEGRACA